MVWFDFKNQCQKDMCSKDIELHARNIILLDLSSINNIIKGTHMTIFTSMIMITLIMNKVIK